MRSPHSAPPLIPTAYPLMSQPAWPPAPPPNETENDKAVRLAAEREAKKIRCAVPRAVNQHCHVRVSPDAASDNIDRVLEQERQEIRKRKPQTKVLLLGAYRGLSWGYLCDVAQADVNLTDPTQGKLSLESLP